MILADIILGSRSWLTAAIVLALVALGMLVFSYRRTVSTSWLRIVCFSLKDIAFVLLAACLVDPLYVGERPRPGPGPQVRPRCRRRAPPPPHW